MLHSYTVGTCEVRPDERRVMQDGKPAVVGARAFDLLICLIEHRDRMLSKAELMDMVWPGVVVEENNLTVHVSALRKLLGPQAIATIPGRGYRFAMDVGDSRAVVDSAVVDTASGEAPPAAMSNGASAASTLSASAQAMHVARTDMVLTLPDKPSIAVLPFVNLSGDAEQDYFTDGVTEDIITELSRFRSLFVIARNSSFSFKGKAVDVRTIAHQLGVRYVLEGSIRRAAQRMRVTAQLCDARTGAQLWAERYDRALADLFDVQEELTRAIVGAIAPQIESTEFQQLRVGRGDRPSSHDLAMRARDAARQGDRDARGVTHDEALKLAQDAVSLDAECGAALGTIAYLHWRQLWAGAGTADAGPAIAEAGLAAARRAIAIDSSDHSAHLWKGMLNVFCDQHQAGLADLRRAHELNPNDALTLSLLGQFEAGAGHGEIGIRHAREALRLSPRDPMRWSYLNSLAWAYFASDNLADALATAQSAASDAPRFYPAHLCLALSHAGVGDIEQAHVAFDMAKTLAPHIVADRLAGHWKLADAAIRQRATSLLQLAAGVAPAKTPKPRR